MFYKLSYNQYQICFEICDNSMNESNNAMLSFIRLLKMSLTYMVRFVILLYCFTEMSYAVIFNKCRPNYFVE